MAFFQQLFTKKTPAENYDPAKMQPVIRSSICTGERVAGFKDRSTGQFHEIMLLRSEADLEAFRKRYGITEEIRTIY